jgi:hypothetical protein
MFATDDRKIDVLAADCFPRIGDKIWELDGSMTPFVLRRVSDNRHQIITTCYMQEYFFSEWDGQNMYMSSSVKRVTLV